MRLLVNYFSRKPGQYYDCCYYYHYYHRHNQRRRLTWIKLGATESACKLVSKLSSQNNLKKKITNDALRNRCLRAHKQSKERKIYSCSRNGRTLLISKTSSVLLLCPFCSFLFTASPVQLFQMIVSKYVFRCIKESYVLKQCN